jgi:hypothetical protein
MIIEKLFNLRSKHILQLKKIIHLDIFLLNLLELKLALKLYAKKKKRKQNKKIF